MSHGIKGLECIECLCEQRQVLKKADMIRKNAVESILAERNILISVRNPFVVSLSIWLCKLYLIYFFSFRFILIIKLIVSGSLLLLFYLP